LWRVEAIPTISPIDRHFIITEDINGWYINPTCTIKEAPECQNIKFGIGIGTTIPLEMIKGTKSKENDSTTTTDRILSRTIKVSN